MKRFISLSCICLMFFSCSDNDKKIVGEWQLKIGLSQQLKEMEENSIGLEITDGVLI